MNVNSNYWKCKRCNAVFTSDNKKCNCSLSPSPWYSISESHYNMELETGYNQKINSIPAEFVDDIGYGLYGEIAQYYIKGVDGTLAQLGYILPPDEKLQGIIDCARIKNKKLCQ